MRKTFILYFIVVTSMLHAQFGEQKKVIHRQVNTPIDLEVVDLDDDGDLDLITYSTGGSVQGLLWFPNRGDGTFDPKQDLGYVGPLDPDMEAVDFDQDGDLDIVCMAGSVSWSPNNGNGNFGALIPLSVGGSWESNLCLTDIDNDGDLDIVKKSYSNSGYDGISWYANDGSQTFGTGQFIAEVFFLDAVRASDLDGDGDQDLILTGQEATSQAWYQNDGSGNFTFVPVLDADFGNFDALRISDINGDDHPDVIGQNINADWIKFYHNDNGNFSLGGTLPSSWGEFMLNDLNGDEYPDITVPQNSPSLVVFINDGTGNFPISDTLPDGPQLNLAAGDIDGDGSIDILGTSYPDPLVMMLGNADGEFAAPMTISFNSETFHTLAVADLDGDGLKDVISAKSEEDTFMWFRSEGDGSYEPPASLAPVSGATSLHTITARDMDLDGDQDVLVLANPGQFQLTLYSNDGMGNFGADQIISSGIGGLVNVSVGDVDNDGDPDILCGNSSRQPVIFQNDGTGVFNEGPPLTTDIQVIFHFADLNNDGYLDVLTARPGFNAFINQGDGTFALTDSQVISGTTHSLATTDLNADGHIDLIQNSYRWRSGNGDGTFQTTDQFLALNTDHHFAEVDGDGHIDMFTVSDAEVKWHRNINNVFVEQGSISHLYGLWADQRLFPNDIDGDGDIDLLLISPTEELIAWHENYFLSQYRFEGRVFHDLNADGIRTPDEPGLQGITLQITPSVPALFTLPDGDYKAHVAPGIYNVSPVFDPVLWTMTTPDPITVELTEEIPITTGVDVGLIANPDTSILIPSITLAPAVCSDTTIIWFSIANLGNITENCVADLSLDPTFTFISSIPSPTNINDGQIQWVLDPIPHSQIVNIPIVVVMPSVDLLGTSYVHEASVINPDMLEFKGELLDTLSCSYDPNDKLMAPMGYGTFGAMELSRDTLDYTIRFQNTGNAPAMSVMLRDELDPILDPQRIQILGYSHAVTQMHVESDGEMVIRFDGIQLPGEISDPIGSQGFIRFRIRPIENAVSHMSTGHNTAGIYFDLNEPVITNTTLRTWVDCDQWDPQITLLDTYTLTSTSGDHHQWYHDGIAIPDATDANYSPGVAGNYAVEVTSPFGCTRTTDDFLFIGTGLVSHDPFIVLVKPNPFTYGTELIFAEEFSAEDVIDLFDVQGRLLKSWNGNGSDRIALERGDLQAGTYILYIQRRGRAYSVARLVAE